MSRAPDAEAVYEAAGRWVDVALRTDDSLFTPGAAIWAAPVIDDLYRRFVEQPDESKRHFEEKFRDQLAGAPSNTMQLAAELLYVHFLPAADISGGHKRTVIDTVLSWSPDPVQIPADLAAALDQGIASVGVAFKTYRPFQLFYLLEFIKAWKALDATDRDELLSDPWAFKRFAFDLPARAAQSQRAALLNLVHPEAFEPITSEGTKKSIAAAFSEYVQTDSPDVDRQLAEIRAALNEEYGRIFMFWDDDVRPRWSEDAKGEQQAAWIFQANPSFYDIDRALHELQAIEWTLRQYRKQVEVGDRAYIWRSGPDGGVIAVGTVLTEAIEKPPDSSEDAYYLSRENFSASEPRVKIGIDHVLAQPLSRTMLREDPILKDLRILRFANATVYPVDAPQDARLQELIGGGQRRYWWVNQGQDFAREREHGYITSPLTDRGGGEPAHWKVLTELRVGDRTLHYARTRLQAVGEVVSAPTSGARPEEVGDTGWGAEGHFVRVVYRDLVPTIDLSEIPLDWRQEERGPFRSDGAVNQGYCFPLSDEFVRKLAERFGQLELDLGGGEIERHVEVGFDAIAEAIEREGLTISRETIRRYHLSLKTRGFVVLSGISGTGKTWLAEAYARAAGAECLLVPVAPNWTTNEDLLGYLNPLDGAYHDTEFSRFLRAAAGEYARAGSGGTDARPYHLILDEMNLARVEYYFAKFLSAMELRTRSDDATIELAPDDVVRLPPNLRFTGTVNVDETTHGFADKVYDRSQLIELTISRDDLVSHLGNRPYTQLLAEVWDIFRTVAPFAFRVLDEIVAYIDAAAELSVPWETALDEQLLQKVLTKVKGTDLALGGALTAFVEITADRFPLSEQKAAKMLAEFSEHDFTSYF